MPVIEVSHVTKEYRLGALSSLKQKLLNTGARLMGREVEQPPLFKALDDVSFSVEAGEVVGIIGHNGAGKSTLLKMLAGISTPTSGDVKVKGRIAPLIEVGAGFVPDFTGRENVYLNGSILGMSKLEIERKFDEIVEFSEIAQFIDTPVKRYSSGMQVKLAFAVATSVEAEILIVDEVLAVGDLAFQRKCFDRMEQLIQNQNRTVLLVSHNIRQVERLCTRAILMHHGHVAQAGTARDVCNTFYEQSDSKIVAERAKGVAQGQSSQISSGEVELVALELLNGNGDRVTEVEYLSDITVQIRIQVRRTVRHPVIGIGVHTTDFLYLATNHHLHAEAPEQLEPGVYVVRCDIRRFPLLPRSYAFRLGISVGQNRDTAYYVENICAFRVVDAAANRVSPDIAEGFVALDTQWTLPSPAATWRATNMELQ